MHDPQRWAGKILCSEPERAAFQRLPARLTDSSAVRAAGKDLPVVGLPHARLPEEPRPAHRPPSCSPAPGRRARPPASTGPQAGTPVDHAPVRSANWHDPPLPGKRAGRALSGPGRPAGGTFRRLLRPGRVSAPAGRHQVFCRKPALPGFPLLVEAASRSSAGASGRELMLYRVNPGGSCIISSSCLLGRTRLQRARHRRNAAHPARPADSRVSALMVEHAPSAISSSTCFRPHRRTDATGRGSRLCPPRPAAGQADPGPQQSTLLNVTHQQLADELGSVREIVSRLLKGLPRKAWSASAANRLVVDRDGLQKLATV